MQFIHPSSFLKTVLAVDALGSVGIALAHLLATPTLARWLGLPEALLWGAGCFLVGYVALLAAMVGAARLPRALVQFVAGGNMAWAVACAGLAAGGFVQPTGLGTAYLLAHTVMVGGFAAMQFVAAARAETVAYSAAGGQPVGRPRTS